MEGNDWIRQQTLHRLVAQYQTTLLRTCYLYLRDASLAEDAVQETFLKAYRAYPAFRGECREKTWLLRIATNTCRDMRRSAWFRHVDRRVSVELLPQAAIPYEEADEELTLAILRLPSKLREAVTLYYYQDMGVAEISVALGVAPSTVSNRLKQARGKLRAALEGGRIHE